MIINQLPPNPLSPHPHPSPEPSIDPLPPQQQRRRRMMINELPPHPDDGAETGAQPKFGAKQGD